MVYFIQADWSYGPIKIGYTADKTPAKRLAALQVSNSSVLRVIGFIPNADREWEKYLHAKLAAHRIRGEWFRAHVDVLNFVPFFTDDELVLWRGWTIVPGFEYLHG